MNTWTRGISPRKGYTVTTQGKNSFGDQEQTKGKWGIMVLWEINATKSFASKRPSHFYVSPRSLTMLLWFITKE